MSTSVATSRCDSCGGEVYSTRFCETCGARVEAVISEPATLAPSYRPQGDVVAEHTHQPPQRVRLGLRLALHAFIWAPIVPTLVALGVSAIAMGVGNWSFYNLMWPVSAACAVVVSVLVVVGFVIAAKAAPIARSASIWAVVLAVFSGLILGFGSVTSISFTGIFGSLSSLLAGLAAVGAWGLVGKFRGAGYFALLYVFAASILLFAASIPLGLLFGGPSILSLMSLALWALAVIGVVKLALAHERRASLKAEVLASRSHYPPLATGRTNGFALASLVLAILGGGVLAIVFGHVARSQIEQTGDGGRGMATAGLVIGYISVALSIIGTLVVALLVGGQIW